MVRNTERMGYERDRTAPSRLSYIGWRLVHRYVGRSSGLAAERSGREQASERASVRARARGHSGKTHRNKNNGWKWTRGVHPAPRHFFLLAETYKHPGLPAISERRVHRQTAPPTVSPRPYTQRRNSKRRAARRRESPPPPAPAPSLPRACKNRGHIFVRASLSFLLAFAAPSFIFFAGRYFCFCHTLRAPRPKPPPFFPSSSNFFLDDIFFFLYFPSSPCLLILFSTRTRRREGGGERARAPPRD